MKQVRTPLLALFILIGLGAAAVFAQAAPESSSPPYMDTAVHALPEHAIDHASDGDSLTGSQETMIGANGGGDLAGTCQASWYCTTWSCKEDGTMTRTCFDRYNCGTREGMPPEKDTCEYSPLCFNGIVDEREEGLDCGGSCPPCYTCFDNVRNQGELGVDCGGPCGPCPDCHDGMMNQGETEIDCGGPCPACGTCDNGMIDQDETGVDCGGICGQCVATEQAGKTDGGWTPFRFLAVLAAAMTFLMMNMVVTYHYGKGFLRMFRKKVVIPALSSGAKEEIADKALEALGAFSGTHHSARDIDALRTAVKDYLAALFNLHDNFTPETLKLHLKERKVDPILSGLLVSYVSKLGQVSFAGKAMHAREFQSMVKEAQELVRLTAPRDRNLKVASRERKVSIRVIEKTGEEAYRLMAESYDALGKGDSFLAAEYYHKALGIYEGMRDEEKEDLFASLDRLHREIDLFENVFTKR